MVVEPDRRRVVLGRADGHSPTQPDLDLTAYGAIEKGFLVSMRFWNAVTIH
jgi:hypothetical protein